MGIINNICNIKIASSFTAVNIFLFIINDKITLNSKTKPITLYKKNEKNTLSLII